ncbi:hypothetical protein BLOT_000346 [Blomia tropicalis]|nr:hypothetical protein BLOT_000346 [Blomia tropicalis]
MDDNAGGHLRSHIVLMHWWNLSHLGKVSTPNGPTLWLVLMMTIDRHQIKPNSSIKHNTHACLMFMVL